MSRPPRIQFPGALYHVVSRGNRRSDIFLSDSDYVAWTERLAIASEKYKLVIHAYCQMPNHVHLLVETPEATLANGMRHLNSGYCQNFNKQHGMVGHVLQGRYYSGLIQKEKHLLASARYIAHNPVRAKLVAHPSQWRWGSHRYLTGQAPAPSWLETDWLLSQFGGDSPEARMQAYVRFVDGTDQDTLSPFCIPPGPDEPPSLHQRPSLEQYAAIYPDREMAIQLAYFEGLFNQQQIAEHFQISERTVGRILRAGM